MRNKSCEWTGLVVTGKRTGGSLERASWSRGLIYAVGCTLFRRLSNLCHSGRVSGSRNFHGCYCQPHLATHEAWPTDGPCVIAMDEASVHLTNDLIKLVEFAGIHLLPMPANSPELNPIENSFSCIRLLSAITQY